MAREKCPESLRTDSLRSLVKAVVRWCVNLEPGQSESGIREFVSREIPYFLADEYMSHLLNLGSGRRRNGSYAPATPNMSAALHPCCTRLVIPSYYSVAWTELIFRSSMMRCLQELRVIPGPDTEVMSQCWVTEAGQLRRLRMEGVTVDQAVLGSLSQRCRQLEVVEFTCRLSRRNIHRLSRCANLRVFGITHDSMTASRAVLILDNFSNLERFVVPASIMSEMVSRCMRGPYRNMRDLVGTLACPTHLDKLTASFPNLQKLEVNLTGHEGQDMPINDLVQLRDLNLTGGTPHELRVLSSVSTCFPRLATLSVASCHRFSDVFSTVLPGLSDLTLITFTDLDLIEVSRVCPNLTSLILVGCEMAPGKAYEPPRFQRLQKLRLFSCGGLEQWHVHYLLDHACSLTELHFYAGQDPVLCDSLVSKIARRRRLSLLRLLELTGDSLTSNAIFHVLDGFGDCLRYAFLAGKNLRDLSLDEKQRMIAGLNKLQVGLVVNDDMYLA